MKSAAAALGAFSFTITVTAEAAAPQGIPHNLSPNPYATAIETAS